MKPTRTPTLSTTQSYIRIQIMHLTIGFTMFITVNLFNCYHSFQIHKFYSISVTFSFVHDLHAILLVNVIGLSHGERGPSEVRTRDRGPVIRKIAPFHLQDNIHFALVILKVAYCTHELLPECLHLKHIRVDPVDLR